MAKLSRRERSFFAFGEFLSIVLGIASAFAWTWALGVLVALACMGIIHVFWRVGVVQT